MTRIVAGRFGGRRLSTPRGGTTRPTSEKVRAAIGNILTAGGGLAGASVLDLYAGSGALGLELVSRGAAAATLVERDRAALTAIRTNVTALGVESLVTVVASDVAAFARLPGSAVDVVVADPPYDLAALAIEALLADLHTSGLVHPGTDVLIERAVRSGDIGWPPPFRTGRSRRYGDTAVHMATVD